MPVVWVDVGPVDVDQYRVDVAAVSRVGLLEGWVVKVHRRRDTSVHVNDVVFLVCRSTPIPWGGGRRAMNVDNNLRRR